MKTNMIKSVIAILMVITLSNCSRELSTMDVSVDTMDSSEVVLKDVKVSRDKNTQEIVVSGAAKMTGINPFGHKTTVDVELLDSSGKALVKKSAKINFAAGATYGRFSRVFTKDHKVDSVDVSVRPE